LDLDAEVEILCLSRKGTPAPRPSVRRSLLYTDRITSPRRGEISISKNNVGTLSVPQTPATWY
jgi:hypothetical protein